MNYARDTETIRKHLHGHPENLCIAVLPIPDSLTQNIFSLTKVIFIQRAFKNIQGLLWIGSSAQPSLTGLPSRIGWTGLCMLIKAQ